MNRDVRPSCCSGLNALSPRGRRCQRYAVATVRMSRPVRSRKKDGEDVQNSEFANGLGKCDAANAATTSDIPDAANQALNRRSSGALRASSRRTPMKPPAKTKPAHGKIAKLVNPGRGRR